MVRLMKTALSLLCLSVSLIACADEPPAPVVLTKVKVERVTIPEVILQCPGERPAVPPKPEIGRTPSSDVAIFAAKLWDYAIGCEQKFAEAREFQLRPSFAPMAPVE